MKADCGLRSSNTVAATSLSDIVYKFQVVTLSRSRRRRIPLGLRSGLGLKARSALQALHYHRPQSPPLAAPLFPALPPVRLILGQRRACLAVYIGSSVFSCGSPFLLSVRRPVMLANGGDCGLWSCNASGPDRIFSPNLNLRRNRTVAATVFELRIPHSPFRNP